MAHEIFISYAAEDKPIADAVCEAIESQQIKCWYAPRDVEYGKDFEESIVDAIGASRLIILILTSHSNTSAHVKREIQNACMEEVAVPVLPFRTEDIPLNKSLRYYIGSVHWLDALTPPLEPHLQRLVEHVKARIERSPRESHPQPETDRPSSQSTDEPQHAQSHEPEIIADSTFAEESAPFPEPEFEAEVLPSATRGPNLKTFVRASAIFLLVVIVGIALLLGISSLLASRSPEPGNEPANPSANTEPLPANASSNRQTNGNSNANASISLTGLWVAVYYLSSSSRQDEANRIVERLRSRGARVDLHDENEYYRGYFYSYGRILCFEGTTDNCKRIAMTVSDIENLSVGPAQGDRPQPNVAAEYYIWLPK